MDIGKWADGSYAIPDSRASGVSSEEAESSGLSTQADSSFSEPSIFDDSQDEEK